jgi:hypothetical protein
VKQAKVNKFVNLSNWWKATRRWTNRRNSNRIAPCPCLAIAARTAFNPISL